MKLKYFLILLFLLSFSIEHSSFNITHATIRYVSKTGTSTPPYTSWATAADSIQKCINICSFGDTVYVGNGVYKEQVVMIPGLSLIGAGMDSCVIDTRSFSNPCADSVKSYCLLKGFKIIIQNDSQMFGIGIAIVGSNSIIEYNQILNTGTFGIMCNNTNAIMRHNKISNCFNGIWIIFNQPKVDSNYFYIDIRNGTVLNPSLNSLPIIRGNTIVMNNDGIFGYMSGFNDGANVQNNLFYSIKSDETISAFSQDYMENNIVKGRYNYGITREVVGEVRNNNIIGGSVGIRVISGNPLSQIQYNNVCNNNQNYQNFIPDSTNISVDPMFVYTDSMDFHLQKYSPLIDAGDPNILDKDSTRSDIGLYGGPFGESYKYLDLAPKAPINLTAFVDSIYITLKWNRNTEPDTSYYKVYRDTVSNFTIDSTKLISSSPDTFYIQINPHNVSKYVYKVTCVDKQGNESEPSDEIVVNITSVSVDDYPMTISDYRLYQNYPNPFNPSTTISYRLKERGYVKLYVYDIKGELISVLVNKVQETGFYQVDFSASSIQHQESETRSLASGIYIYQIHIIGEHNIPVFIDIKKMIYLK
jgi:hypothetical protein